MAEVSTYKIWGSSGLEDNVGFTSGDNQYPTIYNGVGDPWSLPNTNSALAITECFLFAIVAALALGGNCLVVISVAKLRWMWTIPNIFLINLAATDISMAILNILVAVIVLGLRRWPFSQQMCEASAFLNFTIGFTSLLTMTLVALNRYLCVCRPTHYAKMFSVKSSVVYIIFTWLMASISAILPILGWGTYSFQPGKSICLLKWSSSPGFVLFFMILTIFLPILILVYCYIAIFRALRESKRQLMAYPAKRISSNQTYSRNSFSLSETISNEQNREERKAFAKRQHRKLRIHRDEVKLLRVMVVVFFSFASCWIPVCLVNMYEAFSSNKYQIPRWLDLSTIFLVYCSSACNPFIYGLLNGQFRRAFRVVMFGTKTLPLTSQDQVTHPTN